MAETIAISHSYFQDKNSLTVPANLNLGLALSNNELLDTN
jgi:hypothetical protein